MPWEDDLRISGRLKNALVADLVMEDVGHESDHYLTEPMNDPRNWTEHLARQLEIRYRFQHSDDIHDTLILILPLLDEMLRQWPPTEDLEPYTTLAHEATKNLEPREVFTMLFGGPARWRQARVECAVANLPDRLQLVLEQDLASELQRVVSRWRTWEIPRLAERRAAALKAKEEADRTEAEAVKRRSTPRRPPGNDADRLPRTGWFTPRGRM